MKKAYTALFVILILVAFGLTLLFCKNLLSPHQFITSLASSFAFFLSIFTLLVTKAFKEDRLNYGLIKFTDYKNSLQNNIQLEILLTNTGNRNIFIDTINLCPKEPRLFDQYSLKLEQEIGITLQPNSSQIIKYKLTPESFHQIPVDSQRKNIPHWLLIRLVDLDVSRVDRYLSIGKLNQKINLDNNTVKGFELNKDTYKKFQWF